MNNQIPALPQSVHTKAAPLAEAHAQPSMSLSEDELRAHIPVFINSFNQPTYLEMIVSQLRAAGFGNICVCDNASTSEPLASYFESLKTDEAVEVWCIGANWGPRKTALHVAQAVGVSHIFSDPDIRLPTPPSDQLLTRMFALSERYRCAKIGLALEIPAPDVIGTVTMHSDQLGELGVPDWEKRFWQIQLEENVYRADVDTTFFLWNSGISGEWRRLYRGLKAKIRPRRIQRFIPGVAHMDIRVAGPGFTVQHLPWYADDLMPEPEKLFYRSEAQRWSTWLR